MKYFFEINTIEELIDFLDNNIKYGWHGIDNITRIDSLKDFKVFYRTMSIDDVLKYKVGTCQEQVNLIKYFLDNKNIENKILVLTGYEIVDGIEKERIHFIIIYKMGDSWYQLEHASRFFKGIFKYGSFDNVKKEILNKYKNILKDSSIFEIDKIPVGLNYNELRNIIIEEIMKNK